MSESAEELRRAPTPESIFADVDRDSNAPVALEAVVSLLTLGFGRFWLVSSVRRHLCSNTKILGDSLVYDGDALESLLQFAIGAAPLAGICFAFYRFGSSLMGDNEAYLYLAAAIFVFAYWRTMRFADWRYRLNHTLWRGRRFRVDGSVAAYFLHAFEWGAVGAVSLGLAWPSAQVALDGHKLKHTHYGSRSFSFVGESPELLSRGIFLLPVWLWCRVLLIFSVPAILVCNSALNENMRKMNPDDWRTGSAADAAGRSMILYILIVVVLLPIVAFAYPRFVALVWKWRIEGVRFGEVYVTSGLKLSSFMGVYFAFYGFIVVFASLGLLVLSALKGPSSADETIHLIAVLYCCVIGLDAVWNWLFARRFWAIIVGSLALHDVSDLAEVS
jgi:uncharacterized membrane protein YjgN (DUF898 family)